MIATSSAASSDSSPAQCDLSLSPPSSRKSVANGIIATSALRNSESPTGSSTCLYMRLSSQGNPGGRSTQAAANANAPRNRQPVPGGAGDCVSDERGQRIDLAAIELL